jgi:hypothetical protein
MTNADGAVTSDQCHPPSHPAPALAPTAPRSPPMPPTPSPTYERLRDTIARRMRMSHVDQPLMLMELLGHGFARQQQAPPPRRTLPSGSWGKT